MELRHYRKGSSCPPLEPGKLRIYGMRFCPFVHRVLFVLDAKNIPYEVVNINLKDRPEWFLEKNPQGKVPVLEQDNKILFESLIIADYLDECYDQKLNFSDPYLKARDRMILEDFGQMLLLILGICKNGCLSKNNDWNSLHMTYVLKTEKELEERGTPFFGGTKPGMLDYMLYPFFEKKRVCAYLNPELPDLSAQFPRATAWTEMMKENSAVMKTLPDLKFAAASLKACVNGEIPNYDIGL